MCVIVAASPFLLWRISPSLCGGGAGFICYFRCTYLETFSRDAWADLSFRVNDNFAACHSYDWVERHSLCIETA